MRGGGGSVVRTSFGLCFAKLGVDECGMELDFWALKQAGLVKSGGNVVGKHLERVCSTHAHVCKQDIRLARWIQQEAGYPNQKEIRGGQHTHTHTHTHTLTD